MTLIELGEISSGSPDDRPVPPPRRADIRRIGVLLATLLVVLTMAGSQRPEPRGLPLLWTAPAIGDQFILTADTLYVQSTAGTDELIAYDAATGAVRWRRTAQQQMYWINADIPGLVLLPKFSVFNVLDENGNTFMQQVVTDSVALDPATGRELWRSAGEGSLWSGDLIQLSVWDQNSTLASFRVVHRTDGRVAWTLTPKRKVTNWTATGSDPKRPDRLVTTTEDGVVEVRRLDTGALVVAKQLPWLAPDPLPGAYSQLYSIGEVLFVLRDNAGRQIVDAYEPETLRRLWSRTISSFNNFFDCGRMLCLNSGTGDIEALDPLTGQRRWTSEGWDYAREVTPGVLLTEPHQGGWIGLVDSTDGHRIVQLPEGVPLLDRAAGRVLSLGANRFEEPLGAPVSQPLPDNSVILRGLIDPVSDAGCQYAGGRLACGLSGGRVAVTDVG